MSRQVNLFTLKWAELKCLIAIQLSVDSNMEVKFSFSELGELVFLKKCNVVRAIKGLVDAGIIKKTISSGNRVNTYKLINNITSLRLTGIAGETPSLRGIAGETPAIVKKTNNSGFSTNKNAELSLTGIAGETPNPWDAEIETPGKPFLVNKHGKLPPAGIAGETPEVITVEEDYINNKNKTIPLQYTEGVRDSGVDVGVGSDVACKNIRRGKCKPVAPDHPGFEEFWDAYPSYRRINKDDARKEWNKQKPDLGNVLSDLEIRKEVEWNGKEPRYVEYPKTYLLKKRWSEDLKPKERGLVV